MTALLNAYSPSNVVTALLVLALCLGILAAGFGLSRMNARPVRLLTWALVAGSVSMTHFLCLDESPGFRMLALIAAGLLAMKAVVVGEERLRAMPPLSLGQWLAFASWPGMKPRLFLSRQQAPLAMSALMKRGLLRFLWGGVFIGLAWLTWKSTRSEALSTAPLLIGLSLCLHFGLCNLLAAFWRSQGVACEALFLAPLRSENLSEFWSRRWNLAFSQMTATAVYRPASSKFGRGLALVASFLFSGLIHEMAISLPVQAGYGLPLGYFALHGLLVLGERSLSKRGRPIHGWLGKAWTIGCVVIPLPMLFHPAFLAGVAWPILGIPG